MAEKVKVSREVAELATKFDHRHSSIGVIEEIICADGYDESQKTQAINAFLNGYEVELTPEEEIAEVYSNAQQNFRLKKSKSNSAFNDGVCDGIRITLDLLNIKIKGVNE